MAPELYLAVCGFWNRGKDKNGNPLFPDTATTVQSFRGQTSITLSTPRLQTFLHVKSYLIRFIVWPRQVGRKLLRVTKSYEMGKLDDSKNFKRQKLEGPNPEISRSIAACQRCRAKKVKCDRNFPQCSKCTKAGLDCVGIDPASGREVPRSYVFHLEQRVRDLERQLEINGLNTPQMDTNVLACSPHLGAADSYETVSPQSRNQLTRDEATLLPAAQHHLGHSSSLSPSAVPLAKTLHGNSSESSYLGASLGITFAKLMMAAVKFKGSPDSLHPLSSNNSSMDTRSAVLPPKSTAQRFTSIFFNQSNTQLPILHREVFLETIFEPIYGFWDPEIHLPSSGKRHPKPHLRQDQTWLYQYKQIFTAKLSAYNSKADSRSDGLEVQDELEILQTISDSIEVPKRFQRPLHYLNLIFAIASSSNHLQYMNSISEQFRNAAMKYIDSISENGDPMEELQSSLLLTLYSLMRPCVDGVWYILGKCLRLCVDLGLHNRLVERTQNLEAHLKDRRRRLFWCTYSLDRQVCFYLGRPVGIPESSIDSKFPSMLEDSLINEQNTLDPRLANSEVYQLSSTYSLAAFKSKTKDSVFCDLSHPRSGRLVDSLLKVDDYSDFDEINTSYKHISGAFFRIRHIQLEVQRILYEDEEISRRFNDISQWKAYIMEQLQIWLESLPEPGSIADCDFHSEFFLLNYNHTLLMINGLSPKSLKLSPKEFQIVARSLQNIMRCYTQLYVKKSINYTWAAVHNLFIAGTSFLFVLYHSDEIRQQYEMHQVMKITGDCISILSLLKVSCDAAKSCSESFQVLTAAVLKLKYDVDVDANYETRSNTKSSRTESDGNKDPKEERLDDEFAQTNGKDESTIDPRNAVAIHASFNGSLEQGSTHHSEIQEGELVKPVSDVSNRLAGLLEIQGTEILSQTPNDFVPQFEWISRKTSEVSDPFENSNYANGKNLDTFFSEVANLSPTSSRRNYSGEKDRSQLEAQSSSDSNPKIPQRDAKKVFELIQQVPTESIWDQFFAKPQGLKNQESPANI